MVESSVVHQLVAQFLKRNNYKKTLEVFEQEHGKPIPAEPPTDETLDEIVHDRIGFKQISNEVEDSDDILLDQSLKDIVQDQLSEWTAPYPAKPHPVDLPHRELIISSAIVNKNGRNLLFLSSVKMRISVIDMATKKLLFNQQNLVGRVVIKKIEPLSSDAILFASMDGKIHYFNIDTLEHSVTLEPVSSEQIHKKLISDARYIQVGSRDYLVSLGWDFTLRVHQIEPSTKAFTLIAEYTLQTQGSCFDVLDFQGSLIVVLGKNENTLLDVLHLDGNNLTLLYKISLNDAEFTSSSFSPRYITVSPATSGAVPLVAVATSHEPYMRVIVVTLKELESILNPTQSAPRTDQSQPHPSHSSEDTPSVSAPVKRCQIMRNVNTMSPQDKYSQPLIAWRLPGTDTTLEDLHTNPPQKPTTTNHCSPKPTPKPTTTPTTSTSTPSTTSTTSGPLPGLWVAGEDGILRGLDLRKNDIAVALSSHDSKIKSFAHSYLHRKECLLTCGNDQLVNLWY